MFKNRIMRLSGLGTNKSNFKFFWMTTILKCQAEPACPATAWVEAFSKRVPFDKWNIPSNFGAQRDNLFSLKLFYFFKPTKPLFLILHIYDLLLTDKRMVKAAPTFSCAVAVMVPLCV